MKHYTKEQIQLAIDSSLSMRQAAATLGCNFKTFRTYAKQFDLYNPNPYGVGIPKPKRSCDLEDVLTNKIFGYSSHRLKGRLIKERGWRHLCSHCSLEHWNNLPIPLELDHIDGDHYNNSEQNLRFLCPNCHAQTPTYRNKKRA